MPGRRNADVPQVRGEDEAHLVEVHRPHGSHRPELGEPGEHAFELAQRDLRQALEMLEPFAPRRSLGQRREPLDQGKREGGEVREVGHQALELGDPRLVGVVERGSPHA